MTITLLPMVSKRQSSFSITVRNLGFTFDEHPIYYDQFSSLSNSSVILISMRYRALKTVGCNRLCISSSPLLLRQIYWNERQLRDTGICSSHSTCWSQIYQEKQPPS